MGYFTKEEVTKHIYRIRGLGDACMYFIHGENSGALIDTAYGVGDLKGYIESFWKKPYVVICTHGHADHANGIAQWDEVYLNKKDRDLYFTKVDTGLRRTMLKRTVKNIDEIKDEEFQPAFTGKFLDIEDNQQFDLGGATIKVYAAPGHTQGIVVLLVPEDRTILFGDACGVATFLFKPESSTVAQYKETLDKLKDLSKYYDRILRQHGDCESQLSIVDENLEAADCILNHTDDRVPFEYMGQKVWIAKEVDPTTAKRKDGKTGNIFYSDDKIK